MPPNGEGAADAFYAGVLGMAPIAKPPELRPRGGCWFVTEDVEVHLGVEEPFAPARKAHPAFVVDDLDAVRSALTSAGFDVVEDTQLEGFERFYTSDPFGNRLEFLARVRRSRSLTAQGAASSVPPLSRPTNLRPRAVLVSLAAVVVCLASTVQASAATGALTPRGCIADPVNNPAGCAVTTPGLDGAITVAVSADGTFVYAIGEGDNAIVRFHRDPTTGALRRRGCIAERGNNPDGCTQTARGLANPYMAAISRDGTSLYVVAGSPGTIVRFDRNPRTGALRTRGCVSDTSSNPDGCAQTARGLGGANAVAISPDGGSVYVAGYNDNAIVTLRRNPRNGAIHPRGCIGEAGDNVAGCARTIVGGIDEPYVGGVTVSPDSRFVYAEGSAGPSIAIFHRSRRTGTLRPRGCIADASSNTEGCPSTAPGLAGPYMLAISPDGTSAYAADYGTSGIVRFKRDLTTGALRPRGCIAAPTHNNRGCGQTAAGLWGTEWVAVSADGRSVYAAGANDGAIVRFARNRTTGALTGRGCVGDVASNPAGCAITSKAVQGVQAFALSRDATSLYAASVLNSAILTFRRATR